MSAALLAGLAGLLAGVGAAFFALRRWGQPGGSGTPAPEIAPAGALRAANAIADEARKRADDARDEEAEAAKRRKVEESIRAQLAESEGRAERAKPIVDWFNDLDADGSKRSGGK